MFLFLAMICFFFFKQKTAYELRISDWSSDVCSSDLFASAGALQYIGIRVPFAAFFAHDSGKRPAEAPTNMLIAMVLAAALCIGIGVWPSALYAILPFAVDYNPYTDSHVLSQMQLLVFSALAFTVLKIGRAHV